MNYRFSVCASAALLAAVFVAKASAQPVIGGFLGAQMDTQEDFLAIGAEALFDLGTAPVIANPSLTYFFQDGVTELQLDGNVLYLFDLEGDPRLEPFFSAGLALNVFSFDGGEGFDGSSETNVGLNVGAGAQLRGEGQLAPFMRGQYTMINDWPNRFLVTIGVRYTLGSR